VYLKSLTLKGFKSFAQPTTFAFETGVTCVVGPNGSGKSNVVDALAWVMGEQGAKTLRGGKMDDVIFAGTATRGPLGRAEVLLTIDNADGALPIEYSEVTISRTLFRNGQSEYAINGEGCRLLDVQELLSDSGLGREMHVIVGQGRLDDVLAAGPEDRRGFIEEAAGILKHRRRKEKTVRKLDAMQANLTRLSDLAGEVRRQLKPLGAQAEVAREAQSIQAELRDARARILADDVVALRATLDIHNQTESERHTERIVLQEQLERAVLQIRHIEADQSGDDVDVARRLVFALESMQERLRGLYTLANQRLSFLGADSEATPLGSGVTPAMIEAGDAEVERLRATIGEAETAWKGSGEATIAARAALDAIDEQIAAQSALVAQYDLDLNTLRGKRDAADARLASVRSDMERQQNSIDAARQRRDQARSTLALAESESMTDAGATALNDTYEQAQVAVVAADALLDELRDSLHSLERERDLLQGRTGALTMALDQRDGSSAVVAAKLSGIRGLVAEHVSVTPGFESAIAAALGSLSDAVLADDIDSGVDAMTSARRDDLGRVELVVAAGGGAVSAKLPNIPGLTPAADVVTAPDGVMALLAHTLIADDLDAARAAWKGSLAKISDDVTVITRDGDVLTRYVLRGGSAKKQSRIELVAERDVAATRLDEVVALIDSSRFALADQRGVAEAAKELSTAALKSLRDFDAQLAQRSEALNRARVQAEAADAELVRIEEGLAHANEQLAQVQAEAESATAELSARESQPRPVLDAAIRDGALADLERLREAEVQARLDLETARERVRAEELRVDSLRQQLEADRQAAEETARRMVIRRQQMDAATAVAEDLPLVLASIDRSVSEARVRLAQREADRTELNEKLSGLRVQESQLRERLAQITENVHGLELQIYEKKMHLSSLLERAATDLGLDEDVLIAEYGPEVGIPVESGDGESEGAAEGASTSPYIRAEQEARLIRAERKIGQLGRVNPLALEEFAALEQRHQFLTEQLKDLDNTRKDLLTIIDEVDSTMQTVFAAAFDDVKRAFTDVFPILFPGGQGSITLTDPDDMLTTGVDVMVKPAGKKIDRLSLLSGGERSLAAVAFLVAIFKARPSPFYILDEVEAALDDANLGRLLTIFEELRASSQLIVITHQKRTMEIADALYGVSMRQDGVSAVVGQRVAQKDASKDGEKDAQPSESVQA
jgi:chromosome segregation protein